MKQRYELHDVPKEKVDQVVKDFESEGATVEKLAQSDGNWTVIAYLPTIHLKRS